MERIFRIFLESKANVGGGRCKKCKWCEQPITSDLTPFEKEPNYISIEFSTIDKLFFHVTCFRHFRQVINSFHLHRRKKFIVRHGDESKKTG